MQHNEVTDPIDFLEIPLGMIGPMLRISIPGRYDILAMRAAYSKMVDYLRKTPAAINCFTKLLNEFLAICGTDIQIGDQRVCFTVEDLEIANFVVVVMGVTIVCEIGKQYEEVELLILSHHTEPKTVLLTSSELISNKWLVSLGIRYIFKRWFYKKMEQVIRKMAKYAPTYKEYRHQGWSDDGSVYVMGECILSGDVIIDEE